MTGARGWGPGAGGSWLGCGFGQASRVFWRLGGVIAIGLKGSLEPGLVLVCVQVEVSGTLGTKQLYFLRC